MLARRFPILTESLAPSRQHLVHQKKVQLKFFTHRIAFCSAFLGRSDGSTRAIASSIGRKVVLKIDRDENKNEWPKVIDICKFNL